MNKYFSSDVSDDFQESNPELSEEGKDSIDPNTSDIKNKKLDINNNMIDTNNYQAYNSEPTDGDEMVPFPENSIILAKEPNNNNLYLKESAKNKKRISSDNRENEDVEGRGKANKKKKEEIETQKKDEIQNQAICQIKEEECIYIEEKEDKDQVFELIEKNIKKKSGWNRIKNKFHDICHLPWFILFLTLNQVHFLFEKDFFFIGLMSDSQKGELLDEYKRICDKHKKQVTSNTFTSDMIELIEKDHIEKHIDCKGKIPLNPYQNIINKIYTHLDKQCGISSLKKKNIRIMNHQKLTQTHPMFREGRTNSLEILKDGGLVFKQRMGFLMYKLDLKQNKENVKNILSSIYTPFYTSLTNSPCTLPNQFNYQPQPHFPTSSTNQCNRQSFNDIPFHPHLDPNFQEFKKYPFLFYPEVDLGHFLVLKKNLIQSKFTFTPSLFLINYQVTISGLISNILDEKIALSFEVIIPPFSCEPIGDLYIKFSFFRSPPIKFCPTLYSCTYEFLSSENPSQSSLTLSGTSTVKHDTLSPQFSNNTNTETTQSDPFNFSFLNYLSNANLQTPTKDYSITSKINEDGQSSNNYNSPCTFSSNLNTSQLEISSLLRSHSNESNTFSQNLYPPQFTNDNNIATTQSLPYNVSSNLKSSNSDLYSKNASYQSNNENIEDFFKDNPFDFN
eukprot:TRINITY_DN7268_c0_g1_i1.p1 TRINITY_DN7268_c0_g1~~TRINITY_DN7268_c0_g1_i1.p1  ORF type:complete len:674 (-),score=155.59 TRINITY_DN7268_c0_g1_i1:87-2108(-)